MTKHPFKNGEDFLHQFLMDNGQMMLHKTKRSDIIYPALWLERFTPIYQLADIQADAIKYAKYDDCYSGHTVRKTAEMTNLSEKQIRSLINAQLIGAVKKYRRWYVYRPAVLKLIEDLKLYGLRALQMDRSQNEIG